MKLNSNIPVGSTITVTWKGNSMSPPETDVYTVVEYDSNSYMHRNGFDSLASGALQWVIYVEDTSDGWKTYLDSAELDDIESVDVKLPEPAPKAVKLEGDVTYAYNVDILDLAQTYGKSVGFTYRKKNGESKYRIVRPENLYEDRKGEWHVVGHDVAKNATRDFRLDRIEGEVNL